MADSPPNERVAELGPVTGAPVVRAATLAPLGAYVVPPGRKIKLEMAAAAAKPLKKMVEPDGIEPTTSTMLLSWWPVY
jgi:hypothetical protein